MRNSPHQFEYCKIAKIKKYENNNVSSLGVYRHVSPRAGGEDEAARPH